MRRHFTGAFLAQDLGRGAWRLSRSRPTRVDILLRGAQAGADAALRPPRGGDLDVEWGADGVLLTLNSDGRRQTVGARSAIVHEPVEYLYDALPLVTLDDKARRFWRRVFLLVRLPGGRYLLGVFARHARIRQ